MWRLETLRLQRARVAAAARTFLIDFTNDLSFALKDVLDVQASSLYRVGVALIKVSYVGGSLACSRLTSLCLSQNGDTVRQALDLLDPAREIGEFAHSLRPQASEPRVYCELSRLGKAALADLCSLSDKNFFVGECRDLLFGVSLLDYNATHPELLVPHIVQLW